MTSTPRPLSWSFNGSLSSSLASPHKCIMWKSHVGQNKVRRVCYYLCRCHLLTYSKSRGARTHTHTHTARYRHIQAYKPTLPVSNMMQTHNHWFAHCLKRCNNIDSFLNNVSRHHCFFCLGKKEVLLIKVSWSVTGDYFSCRNAALPVFSYRSLFYHSLGYGSLWDRGCLWPWDCSVCFPFPVDMGPARRRGQNSSITHHSINLNSISCAVGMKPSVHLHSFPG